MNRIIINADDCGRSQFDDDAIESAIQKGLITSTTVMANMDDLEGAVKLYEKYNDRVSFGVHLNLSEGEPLKPSKAFVDSGFCIDEGGRMIFGFIPDLFAKGPIKAKIKYQYSRLNSDMKGSIYNELKAQILKLRSVGIEISHIDSHNHMHLSPFILPIVCEVAREFNIIKMRHGVSGLGNSLKCLLFKSINAYDSRIMKGFKQTDIFCSVKNFTDMVKDSDKSYEVMCHPGITYAHYPAEMKYLEDNIAEIRKRYQLITYRDI